MKRALTPFDGFDQFFGQFGRGFEPMTTNDGTGMAVDVANNDDEFVLTADLPGFDREAIELRIDDAVVTISAERHNETDGTNAEYLHRERRTESVQRQLRLPEAVDDEGATATYHNGVLTVTVPKASTDVVDDGRRIEIE
ncbi:Hsp20/alpha crystallin family protein [Halohasta salina]|uniref:Hsp20/alpha crystallin family protein n=1 Tax=Halohasta salina TaxID=2961621 RepID=UPI0020A46791|nr:Hsp20/alpha crystallin family protein [Halohasta salina]